MGRNVTGIIASELNDCDSTEVFRQQIFPMLRDQRSMWMERMEQILAETGLSCGRLAKLCRVSEPAVRKWRKGALPQSRDMYIRIGFAAGYDLEEMNTFLKRYGKCPQLYVKSLEDSVCMFVLRSKRLEHSYETYLKLLDTVRQELEREEEHFFQTYDTVYLSDYLARVESTGEMVAFARRHAPSYRQAYGRLYDYVLDYLDRNLESEHIADGDGRRNSFHAMAQESQWSSSLRHCVSEIRARRWFPLRHKVISLGLHLNMDADSINRMLELAQMEPLYARNPVEAAIFWAVEEAKLDSPEDAILQDGSADLRKYVIDKLTALGLAEEEDYLIEDLK